MLTAAQIIDRNSLPCPFEMDGIEASGFLRTAAQQVHLAFLRRDYYAAQKVLVARCSTQPTEEKLRNWARDPFAKRIGATLNRYEVLTHRWASKRLENVTLAFYAAEYMRSGCYLGVRIHHRETGPVIFHYNFGFNIKEVMAYE